MKVIECVPNFSEGSDQKKIKLIAEEFKSFSRVLLADFSGDVDHNRSVFSFLGSPADVLEAALAACGRALELIDMTRHKGVHPRLGAVDVVPFIPLASAKMKDAIDTAHRFGQLFYKRFGVPVYFYGEAALDSSRRELADIRRGGYAALAEKLSSSGGAFDVGKPVVNSIAGATCVGARQPLVAYNINLSSDDLNLAKKIAAQIREKNGGLKNVQAIGVFLSSRGIAQVSMNLTDYQKTPLKPVYDLVKQLSENYGVEILESELIGLAPAAAFAGTDHRHLKLRNFSRKCLLETHLEKFRRRSKSP